MIMIKNTICHVEKAMASEIVQAAKMKHQTFLVELDGSEIQSWEDYIIRVETLMRFPTTCVDNIDRYLDWIRDLSWLNCEGYILIIYHFDQFLSRDSRIKTIIMESFESTVLPWWQSEIEQFQVEGKAKPFNVYLVD